MLPLSSPPPPFYTHTKTNKQKKFNTGVASPPKKKEKGRICNKKKTPQKMHKVESTRIAYVDICFLSSFKRNKKSATSPHLFMETRSF